MTFDNLFEVIQRYGFPAAMCLWFMLRTEKKLDAIEYTNHRQAVIMAVLVQLLRAKKSIGDLPEEYLNSDIEESLPDTTELAIPNNKGKSQ